MTSIKNYALSNSAILRIAADREQIDMSPHYQRRGGIWTIERKQLLIDSILNEYDIPKIYFHHLLPWYAGAKDGKKFKYAVIDGRQRLSAIFDYLDDRFTTAGDFVYLEDERVKASGLLYSEMSEKYPRLKVIFDSFTLPITLIETEDLELIEDMFSRLNEASPLSSAEKRNAFGGPMASAIREVSVHEFFSEKSRISNQRYQHREMAARLLFVEECMRTIGRVTDTKKPYLDNMVVRHKESNDLQTVEWIKGLVEKVLDHISEIFRPSDPLLAGQALVVPMYVVFRNRLDRPAPNRKLIEEFRSLLTANRYVAERSLTDASFEFLEFDRMSQQGTNDAYSISARADILSRYLDGEMHSEVDKINRAMFGVGPALPAELQEDALGKQSAEW